MKPFPIRRSLGLLVCTVLLSATAFGQTGADFFAQGLKAYNSKDYAKSAELYRKAYTAEPKSQLTALYNVACCFALMGKKDDAFATLDELAKAGYNEPSFAESDTDFATIRTDARWKPIIAALTENAKKHPPAKRWTAPYKILDLPANTAGLVEHLGTSDSAVWLDGDMLSFIHRSKAANVRLSGGIQEAMQKLPGTDVWLIQLTMPGGWDKAFDTYNFVEDGNYKPSGTVWRGRRSPKAPEAAAPLQGRVEKRTIHSDALNEDRRIFIYLPPNAPAADIPAVFMADGDACEDFAKVLEPLILAHKVQPCAIVGMAAGTYKGDMKNGYDMSKDFRALEYLPGIDPDRYNAHMKFFCDEVGAYVAKEFGISTSRDKHAVTGFSNGGAFAAGAAFARPDFFCAAMPLSLGIPPTNPVKTANTPAIYFAAGTLESFGMRTGDFYEKVKALGVRTSYDTYTAGHDSAMWQMAFSRLIPKVFPAQ